MTKEEKVDALKVTVLSRGWQDVIKPAGQAFIENNTSMVINNTRLKGEEDLPDSALKERVKAMQWVLSWEKTFAKLVDELEQLEAYRAQTEPATPGGSPL